MLQITRFFYELLGIFNLWTHLKLISSLIFFSTKVFNGSCITFLKFSCDVCMHVELSECFYIPLLAYFLSLITSHHMCKTYYNCCLKNKISKCGWWEKWFLLSFSFWCHTYTWLVCTLCGCVVESYKTDERKIFKCTFEGTRLPLLMHEIFDKAVHESCVVYLRQRSRHNVHIFIDS